MVKLGISPICNNFKRLKQLLAYYALSREHKPFVYKVLIFKLHANVVEAKVVHHTLAHINLSSSHCFLRIYTRKVLTVMERKGARVLKVKRNNMKSYVLYSSDSFPSGETVQCTIGR